MLSPVTALAERHRIFIEPRVEIYGGVHHHRHWRGYYVEPRYPYAPYGYYDAWGYWHPYYR
jgi:hypothetical protein